MQGVHKIEPILNTIAHNKLLLDSNQITCNDTLCKEAMDCQ